MAATRFAFNAEWDDPVAGQTRKFVLCYYQEGDDTPTVEMIDLKSKRVFLKKTAIQNVSLDDIFIGALVNIYSRQLHITGYADDFTANTLSSKQEHTLVMIKPDAVDQHVGGILAAIGAEQSLSIAKLRMTKLSKQDAQLFYAEHESKEFYGPLCEFMSSGPVVAIDIVGVGAIQAARKLIGPTNSDTARVEAPNSLRAKYGTDGRRNAVHGSDSTRSATRELMFMFEERRGQVVANFGENSTLCLVKPHALGKLGDIIQFIANEGYSVTGMQSFCLDRVNATEFLEVYKGVVPEFASMVGQLTEGPLVAIEVTGGNGQESFRPLCGPVDPEIARKIRPNTIRAKFGADKIKNAVHCTDLAEDSALELEYFFSLLVNTGKF